MITDLITQFHRSVNWTWGQSCTPQVPAPFSAYDLVRPPRSPDSDSVFSHALVIFFERKWTIIGRKIHYITLDEYFIPHHESFIRFKISQFINRRCVKTEILRSPLNWKLEFILRQNGKRLSKYLQFKLWEMLVLTDD